MTGACAGHAISDPSGLSESKTGPSQPPRGGRGTQAPEQALGPPSDEVASVPASLLASGQGSFKQCPGHGSTKQHASASPSWATRPTIGWLHWYRIASPQPAVTMA